MFGTGTSQSQLSITFKEIVSSNASMSPTAYNRVTKLLTAAGVTIPPLFLIRDNFFSVYHVNDDSMEPTLKQNDIVLVRKVDFFPYYHQNGLNIKDLEMDSNSVRIDEETDRLKNIRMNTSAGKAPIDEFTVWTKPPISLPGDIVAFKNPQMSTPIQIEMKRIVGLGGQRIRPKDSYNEIKNIPPYSIWIENDNEENSNDSRKFGAVSRKLVVGHADRIIWPISRWGKLERERPPLGRAWWP